MGDSTQIERIAKRVSPAILRRIADHLDSAAARHADGELRLSFVLGDGAVRSARLQPPWESIDVGGEAA